MKTLNMPKRYPSHKRRKIAVVHRPQHQVPVITHQAIPANTHAEAFDTFCKDLLKRKKVIILFKYSQTPIRTI
jgi:predicted GIY-YIG superfamily endonuclease